MIGPILRAPRRAPRATPRVSGLRRKAKNLVTDLFEYALAPFARWERETLEVVEVAITVAGLPPAFDGYRIAFLTDLHTSPLVPRWWLERAIVRALELRPDLVALGGDFLDDDPHYIGDLDDILRPLAAPDGVVAVLGNHDHYVGAGAVREQLQLAGVHELLNTHRIVVRGGSRLAVGGVGDLECDIIDTAGVFRGVGSDVPRVVLSHDPDVFAYWPDDVRLDLMLAGHTHGGQAYLPLVGPPYVPSQFGYRYLKGLIRERERQLYVSRGIGASGVPIRWKCPPELTLAVLRPRHS